MGRIRNGITVIFICSMSGHSASLNAQTPPVVIRAGHFSNIPEALVLLGKDNDAFEMMMAPYTTVDWKILNAGPAVIEATFAGQHDLVNVGPSPAINGFVRSKAQAPSIS